MSVSRPPKNVPPGVPIVDPQKGAKPAKHEVELTQAEKFERVAREHGTDQDEEAFKGVLRKLAKPKPN